MSHRVTALVLIVLFSNVLVPEAAAERPQLALVIDDLGWHMLAGKRVLALPGPITVAVLPGTPVGRELAMYAHDLGIEIMLHQPMAAERIPNAGPGNMELGMDPNVLTARLRENLAQIPHHSGVSNHMGSLLTRCEQTMSVLMTELARRGLYFLDSRTTARSVAYSSARSAQVPATRRDVFIDTILDTQAIERALESAVLLAEQRGHAVAIGHPHAATLTVLERHLPAIMERVQLVPVSTLVNPRPAQQLAHEG
ncbi:MAG: divergent polysaccharide deacetylase family protein [Gammaproteobacteria bacterium]|nr:MAG: divergent polysaccharide deacetylase family protein [Gammaproteobacteria bacterium]